MNLRQFNNVIAVLETGSIGKAAKALHIAQPALTKSIQRLEQELGVPLFYRTTRGMQPTIYAERLRTHAQAITVGVSQVLTDINALKAGMDGELSIAAPPLIAADILANGLVRLSEKKPGLKTRVTTATNDPIPGLLAGDYDLVVNLIPPGAPVDGVDHKLLFEDRLVVIARRGHPIMRRKPIHVRDLESCTWILPLAGNVHRRRLESMFESEQLPAPKTAIECNSIPFIEKVVAQSDHLGITTKVAAQTSKERLSIIEFESPSMIRPIGLMWRAKSGLSAAAKTLIAEIEIECGKHKPLLRKSSTLHAVVSHQR